MKRGLQVLFSVFAILFMLSCGFATTFKVTIQNPNNYDLTDYQVRIDLSNYLSQATNLIVCTDWSDCESTQLPFCYEQTNGECNTNPSAIIWVKVPSIPANGETVIYIETTDTNYAKNGDQVFDFYDDFNDGTYTDKWDVASTSGATISETNGYLEISGGSSGETILLPTATYSFSDFILEARVWADSSSEWETSLVFRAQDASNLYLFHMYQNPGTPTSVPILYVKSSGSYTKLDATTYSYPKDGNWHLAKLAAVGSSLSAYYDGNLLVSVTDSTYSSGTIGLRVYYGRLGRWDWIRVRKYADQEPTYTIAIVNISYNITDYVEVTLLSPKAQTYFTSKINVSWTVEGNDIGLVAYWKFDEGSGDVVHDSADGNDGQIYNMYSLEFDGEDDYVEVADDTSLKPNETLTITAWIKVDAADDKDEIVSKLYNGGYGFRLMHDGKLNFQFLGLDANWYSYYSNISITFGEWHFVAVVFDYTSNIIKFYIDNQPAGSYDISQAIKYPSTNVDLFIGTEADPNYRDWFDGRIAEVRIYNRTLSDEEIQTLFEKGPGYAGDTTGLVLWLDFTKKSLADQSGNGNDGTAYGDPQWVVDAPYSGWVDGKWGKALRFDGVDDYVEIPHSSNLASFADTDELTVVGWWKLDEVPNGWTVLVGKSRTSPAGFNLHYAGDKKLYIWLGLDGKRTCVLVYYYPRLVGEWTFIAFTVKNGTTTLYINGQAVKTSTHSANLTDGGGSLYINGGQAFWKGLIDEVRIYNRALSEEEIKALYEKNKHKYLTKIYVDGQLVNETYTYNNETGQTTLTILKQGSHSITVKAISLADPSVNDSTTVDINLDLYDYSVTYTNYTTYNSQKYVDTLAYELKVRCGVLDHNITISTWNGRTYTIVCDNTTKVIMDSYRASQEGAFSTSFTLNAVDPSDTVTFGEDSFIADLFAPIFNYTTHFYEAYRPLANESLEIVCIDNISPSLHVYGTIEYYAYDLNIANATPTNLSYIPWNKFNFSLVCEDLVGHKTTIAKNIVRIVYFGTNGTKEQLAYKFFVTGIDSKKVTNYTSFKLYIYSNISTVFVYNSNETPIPAFYTYPLVNEPIPLDMFVIYGNEYETRTWQTINNYFDGKAKNVTLWINEKPQTQLVTIRIQDKTTKEACIGCYVFVKRFIENSWQTVFVGKTNEYGEVVVPLIPFFELYTFSIVIDDHVINYGPTQITTNPTTITIDFPTTAEGFTLNAVTYEWNITKNWVIVRYTAPGIEANEACLRVYKLSLGMMKELEKEVCAPFSLSGTLILNISSLYDGAYLAELTFDDRIITASQFTKINKKNLSLSFLVWLIGNLAIFVACVSLVSIIGNQLLLFAPLVMIAFNLLISQWLFGSMFSGIFMNLLWAYLIFMYFVFKR